MKTTTEVNEYEQQAIDFLTKTGTELSVAFVRYGKHFDDDKDSRDIYNVTLKRGSREFTFKFGQSINCSMEWEAKSIYAKNHWSNAGKPRLIGKTMIEALRCIGSYPVGGGFTNKDFVRNANFSAPNAYDVLTCLTKYDVGSFEDFCSEFGHDTDSRKAEKTYKAVLNEWQNVAMLWNDEEIEALQEIQ